MHANGTWPAYNKNNAMGDGAVELGHHHRYLCTSIRLRTMAWLRTTACDIITQGGPASVHMFKSLSTSWFGSGGTIVANVEHDMLGHSNGRFRERLEAPVDPVQGKA
mmetsp:Transcript_14357/g.37268  ORF Transcript_14357/g.37268 Transcript_14357/m.37268 type:complete len:107 (+) Transcript_14357:187-507(+)